MDLEFPITAAALGRRFEASVIGNGAAEIRSLSSLQAATEGSLSFFSNKKYAALLNQLKGAVLLTSSDLVRPELPLTYIVVKDPQLAFAQLAEKYALKPGWKGIAPEAMVHPSVKLGKDVHVGPFVLINEGVTIGEGTVIYPYTYVGAFVEIGEQCEVYPHVTLMDRVKIGNRVKIFPGSVIGSNGFGYFETSEAIGRSEMPQIGTVVIEDDVRIGAHCTIDRGTLGETRISARTKLDDQVHIGHNAFVGKDNLLCGQVGISGSAVLEDNVILAGQVGVGDHVRVGKGAIVGAQGGVPQSIEGNESYWMCPATPLKDALRITVFLKKLPEMWERLKRIEQKLNKES